MTAIEHVRTRRHREQGQILTLVVLTMATMAVMAMTAITFGQALVRRQQAQLVVDAAALAGAAEQAKGLNTISRINKRQYDLLNALAYAQGIGMARGYTDSSGTTWNRIYRALCPWCYGDDWAIANWKSYESDVFQRMNTAVARINNIYAPEAKPAAAARRIVEQNFDDESNQGLFKNETPDYGVIIPVHERIYRDRLTELVELRPAREYRIGGGRWYKPESSHYSVVCREFYGPVPDPICIAAKNGRRIGYAKENGIFNTMALFGDVPKYHLGHFYGIPRSRDIRFTYYVQVEAARPIFGADFLKEIPKIVVVASAKPYAGHLGDDFDERAFSNNIVSFGYNEQRGREISYTYRAKLVPVRLVDKLQLASQIGGDDAERFITAFH